MRVQGAYRRTSYEEAPRRRGGHGPARQAAAGGARRSSEFCDSSPLQTFIHMAGDGSPCLRYRSFTCALHGLDSRWGWANVRSV